MHSSAARPWITAGVALTAAGLVAAAPITAPAPPDLTRRDVELTGLAQQTFDNIWQFASYEWGGAQALTVASLANPVQVIEALITNPTHVADIFGDYGNGLLSNLDVAAANLPDELGPLLNAATGWALGPLLELGSAVSGGGADLTSLPEDMLNAFLNGGVPLPGALDFMGHHNYYMGYNGNFFDGLFGYNYLTIHGVMGSPTDGLLGLPVNLAAPPLAVFAAPMTITDAPVSPYQLHDFGVLSALAAQLDGLTSGTFLTETVDSVRDVLLTQVAGSVSTMLNDLGTQLGDGVQGLLGGMLDVTAFADQLSVLGSVLTYFPDYLLGMLL